MYNVHKHSQRGKTAMDFASKRIRDQLVSQTELSCLLLLINAYKYIYMYIYTYMYMYAYVCSCFYMCVYVYLRM